MKKEDPRERLRLEFWQQCARRLNEAELPARAPPTGRTRELYLRKRDDPYWERFPVQRGLFFAVLEDSREGELRVAFIVDHPEYSGRVFHSLAEHKPEIERSLRHGLELDMGDADSFRRQLFIRRRADLTDQARWPEYVAWVVDQMLRLRRILRVHLSRVLSQL